MATAGRPPVIVVLGGININLIGTTPRLPGPGETVPGERFYATPGGKGANQAVAAAGMGALVRMVGRVGDDMFGPGLFGGLRERGVDVRGVATDPDHATGVSVILLDADRQNHIVAIYGANMECDGDQIRAAESALKGADSLLLQMEIPLDVSLAAARAAKERGVRVILDPSPAAQLPREAYELVDILTPNQTEAEVLTGIQVTDPPSARGAAEALLTRGMAAVAVKLGELGVYYATGDGGGHGPSYEVEVTDTVAAGDAFGGALAVALAEDRGLEEAVRYGAAAGALAVTRPALKRRCPPGTR